LFFVCFDWVLYNSGTIPAELGLLAKLERLYLYKNQLTGTPSLFPLTCLQYQGIGLRSSVKSYQYDSVTWFLYVLAGFYIPQVPSLPNLANWSNLTAFCCFALLFSCYLLAGTAEAKEALKAELPFCQILIVNTS
jgi:hypothetical protein